MDGYWAKRLRRHVVLVTFLGAGTAVAVALLAPADLTWRISVTTGWIAGGLLAGTLLLGPLNVLRRRPNPVSYDLRRDVGIWTAMAAAIHSGLGLFVHLGGRPWLYFLWDRAGGHKLPLRSDVFGMANWTGALATSVVALLALLSNDLAIRKLGTPRWKMLQRLNYAVFALVAVHAALYQLLLEERAAVPVALWLAIVLVTVSVQLAGARVRRRRVRSALQERG